MRKTTYVCILKETLPIFFIGMLTFTIILLMDKILKLIELTVSGVNFFQILMLLLYVSPSFLIFTIPIGLLLGTLLAFGRLSGDSEIIAFKASGVSLYQLYLLILILSLSAYLLTSFLVFYGLPWGNRGFVSTLYLMTRSKANIEIKERVFNDTFNGLVIYVDKVPIQGKRMEGILIHDKREKDNVSSIFAKEGFIASNPESQEVVLRLHDGNLHRFEPNANVYQKVKFDTYDLRLELGKVLAAYGARLSEREMSINELKKKIERKNKIGEDTTNLKIEFHRRYAIPLACIIFGLIGVPLGIQPRRSGRSYGFILSVFIILAYYISLTIFEIFAEKKTIPPFVAGWAPNFLFGGLGIYLLVKTARESSFKPLAWLTEALDFIKRTWNRSFGDV